MPGVLKEKREGNKDARGSWKESGWVCRMMWIAEAGKGRRTTSLL